MRLVINGMILSGRKGNDIDKEVAVGVDDGLKEGLQRQQAEGWAEEV